MKKYVVFILILIIIPLNINASRGCCSHHGGISYCGDSGYYICNDGSQSPSCSCSSFTLDTDYINLSDNYSYDYSDYEEEINELTKENDDLKDENNDLKNKNDNLEWLLIILISVIVIRIIYKWYKNSNIKPYYGNN